MVDKHIAHLTTDRTADVDLKTWAIEPIVLLARAHHQTFANEANLVCDSFRERTVERLAELPPRRDTTELPLGA
jgi:hypothetical protein